MINSTQKIIKIGTSLGVTLPLKEIKRLNFKAGEEVQIIVKRIEKMSLATLR